MHHRFSRGHHDRTEVYDAEKKSKLAASIHYYTHITIGLYLLEVLTLFIVLMPNKLLVHISRQQFDMNNDEGSTMFGILQKQVLKPTIIQQMRIDAVLSLLLLVVSFYLYAEHWYLLLLTLLARGFMISFFDNAYHYNTPLEQRSYALNLRLPSLMRLCILNFNLHAIHHQHPGLPWLDLHKQFRKDKTMYSGGYLAMSLKQFAGPIEQNRL